ncbi:MAG: outer membrane beta-barrel protein [gamma proteobacterium endosymbiont of Lamellibrachia anaximandri]|nr:outer membrane beta-barrel protein [gamma proteobacterium endosymbiont of Lamellibrachia anaximandri]MBL3617622.1 outer membrane beta-barrel protein [gamma proteobacterium endosymbiont of Lamellibrachia anaximandri]
MNKRLFRANRVAWIRLSLLLCTLSFRGYASEVPSMSKESDNPSLSFSLELEERYNDNIYADDSFAVSDWASIIVPALDVEFDMDAARLSLDLGVESAFYRNNSLEDYTDGWLKLGALVAADSTTHFMLATGYHLKHEERTSPNDTRRTLSPIVYDIKDVSIGLLHQRGDYQLRAGVIQEAWRYEDGESLEGPVYNGDRDRDIRSIALRLERRHTKDFSWFIQASGEQRIYQQATDDAGLQRDSDGFRSAVGIHLKQGDTFDFEAYLGWLGQAYKEPEFSRLSAVDFALNLYWQPREKWQLSLSSDRTLNETTLIDASGYLETALDLDISYQLTSNTHLTLFSGLALFDYLDTTRRDKTNLAGVAASYQIGKYATLRAQADWSKNRTDRGGSPLDEVGSNDYTMKRILLSLDIIL